MSKQLSEDGLDLLFFNARTHNAWLDMPVSDDLLHRLYDLMKWGPTSANCSPARILFLRTPEAKQRLLPALAPGNVDKTMAAPVTAIIVLLIPTMTHASPIASALDRVMEVAIGGITGLIVSFFLLPSNAHPMVAAAAARTLNQIARALGELVAGLTHGLDMDSLHRIQDGIGQALVQMNAVGAEAEHERSAGLAVGPDTGPLLRTLLRLRHDLVMVGRAAITPLPEAFATRLTSPIANLGAAFADYLRASGAALLARRGPPPC